MIARKGWVESSGELVAVADAVGGWSGCLWVARPKMVARPVVVDTPG